MVTATVPFHQIVAIKGELIINFSIYYLKKSAQLTELSWVITGPITGIINGIETQGLTGKENDPNDRRKVLAVLQTEKTMRKLGPIFEMLQTDLEAFYDQYSEGSWSLSVNIHRKRTLF